VVLLLAAATWAYNVWTVFTRFGLFRWVGTDWSFYYAQAMALRSGDPGALYRLSALTKYVQPLTAFTTQPGEPLRMGPVAYPPLFAWLVGPFTLVPPPVGFALWTASNAAAAAYLAWRAAQLVPRPHRVWTMLAVLTSAAVVNALMLGQITVFLACAVGEWYMAQRAGREGRAGLWLSLLFFKPQYGLLLGPLLVWKGRWRAVGGAALGVGVIVAGSLLVAGPRAVRAFPVAMADMGAFRGGPMIFPSQMPNWRALVVYFAPWIAERRGVLLTVLLSAITVAAVAWVWRGRWNPGERLFPAKVTAVLVATLLTSYHTQLHAGALLAVPLVAALAEAGLSRVTRFAVIATALLPTALAVVAVWLPRMQVGVSPTVPLALVLCLGAVVLDLSRAGRLQDDAAVTEVADAFQGVPLQERAAPDFAAVPLT